MSFRAAINVLGIAILSGLAGCGSVIVNSTSMEPSFKEGASCKVHRISGLPSRGEVVYAEHNGLDVYGKPLHWNALKRVIGLPGDEVEINGHAIKIDGLYITQETGRQVGVGIEEFREEIGGYAYSVIRQSPEVNLIHVKEKVPEGHVYIVGDNRARSYDSRLFGPISRDKIHFGVDAENCVLAQKIKVSQ